MNKELNYLFRVVIAILLGSLIGIERKLREKEAGLRTHAIVSGGACLMMLVSKYGFADSENFDAARVAAQIVSGIGFIGAGTILFKKYSIYGLTTAAGIWTTAGIGMCVGAGLYILSVGVTLVVIIVQTVLHSSSHYFKQRSKSNYKIIFSIIADEEKKIKELFKISKFQTLLYSRKQGTLFCTVTVRQSPSFNEDDIESIIKQNPSIISFEKLGVD